MKSITSLFNFANRYHLDVVWIEKNYSFKEIVREDGQNFEIIHKQDGRHIIILASILPLSDVSDDERTKILERALYTNSNPHQLLSYALNKQKVLIIRADILDSDDVNNMINQYLSLRTEIIKAINPSNLLSVIE